MSEEVQYNPKLAGLANAIDNKIRELMRPFLDRVSIAVAPFKNSYCERQTITIQHAEVKQTLNLSLGNESAYMPRYKIYDGVLTAKLENAWVRNLSHDKDPMPYRLKVWTSEEDWSKRVVEHFTDELMCTTIIDGKEIIEPRVITRERRRVRQEDYEETIRKISANIKLFVEKIPGVRFGYNPASFEYKSVAINMKFAGINGAFHLKVAMDHIYHKSLNNMLAYANDLAEIVRFLTILPDDLMVLTKIENMNGYIERIHGGLGLVLSGV